MPKAELLVEGVNDRHVVWALCKLYDIPKTFSVEVPKDGGVEALLKSIQIRLKISNLKTLGIMLDADQNIESRWASLCAKLGQVGYTDLPKEPDESGTIIECEKMPRVGV